VIAFLGVGIPIQRAHIGETARLYCGNARTVSRSVDWYYQQQWDTGRHLMISGGYLTNGDLGGRLNISGSTLIINNVQKNNSGIYTCVENIGQGKEHPVCLSVYGELARIYTKLLSGKNNTSSPPATTLRNIVRV